MHVKTNDEVIVISGKDRGTKGKIVSADPKNGKVIVEGVAIKVKHQKSKAQGQPGGIIRKESPISASNVMLVCKKCGKPARASIRVLEDGKKIRICKKCGQQID